VQYEIKDINLTTKDIEKIYNSKDTILITESDYGLGEIRFENGKYSLYSIPIYGGKPQLECVDSNANVILSTLNSWC